MKTRHEEIREQATAYHTKYPKVWQLFVQFTLEQINKGFKNYSSKAIFERIRWETDTPDINGDPIFKINNNYQPFYARRFMRMFPEHATFFRTRKQISLDDLATCAPELTPQDFG